MKLNDFRYLFKFITDGKILIGIHENYMIFAFYRSFKDNKIYFYRNIFSSYCVDEEGTSFMDEEWEVPLEDIKTDIVNYDMFLSWGRRNIISDFKYHYDHPDEESNFFHIQNRLKQDGGKIVTFSDKKDDECGLLIGVTSTDDDYYYQYIDSNYKIQNMTCVGGYKIIEESNIPDNLKKFKKLSKKDCELIKNEIWKKMLQNAEVFFTPIYLPHLTPDDLTLFKQYSLLYLNKE